MRITIIGKGMEVSEYMRDVAQKQAAKMSKYFNDDTPMQITMSMQKARHIVEATIMYDGGVIRAESTTGDMYASINTALKKIEKQVVKYRKKLADKLKAGFDPNELIYTEGEEIADRNGELVKTKSFAMKPMTIDEAIMQFELVDHPFYVFRNGENGDINVLYCRNDGNYGLIVPAK